MAQNVNSTAPNLLTVASNHATVPIDLWCKFGVSSGIIIIA